MIQERRVGIVADDLTGANDSIVHFAEAGWEARLALSRARPPAGQNRSAVAVITDSRALPAQDAARCTAEAVRSLADSGINRLFVKIDSTLRGSVAAQIAGAVHAWSSIHPGAFAVVCPAYPAMGRTVVEGRLLVDGIAAELTPVGADPVTPLATSNVAALLPGSARLLIDGADASENAARLAAAGERGRTVIVDATDQTDLERLAEAMELLGSRAVPVGAGGLAVACSRRWSVLEPVVQRRRMTTSQDRVVVVVSSLHEVSRAQFGHLISSHPPEDLRVITPSLEDMIDPTRVERWLAAELSGGADLPRVVVVSTPHERAEPGRPTVHTAASALAAGLASAVDSVFDRARVDALFLMGGEGARAVLDRLGADAILVTHAAREGMPIGTIEGGRADGVTVVTKAGGFGVTEHVTDILRELMTPTGRDRRAPPLDLPLLQPPRQGEPQ